VVFFETKHEAFVALHPYLMRIREKRLTMGIQYFDSLSEEKLGIIFRGTYGSVKTMTIILQGCGYQPDQDFLTFMQ